MVNSIKLKYPEEKKEYGSEFVKRSFLNWRILKCTWLTALNKIRIEGNTTYVLHPLEGKRT